MQQICRNNALPFIGMGLIGGSYAKALRRLGVKNITGVDVNKNVCSRHWQTEL